MGRYPMGTMGLGICSEYSLSRIPSPPQNSTTFMAISLSAPGDLIPARTGLDLELFTCGIFTLRQVITDQNIVLVGKPAADCGQPGRNLLRYLISLSLDFEEEIGHRVRIPISGV